MQIPPIFQLATFTNREENPVRIFVEDVERHVRDSMERTPDFSSSSLCKVFLATLAGIHETLVDDPRHPDEVLAGGLMESSVRQAFTSTNEPQSDGIEFEVGQTMVHFVARETARRILEDLLGEDPHAKLERMATEGDPEFDAFADIIDGLEAKIRNDYWYP
jgi:hypothetical protein